MNLTPIPILSTESSLRIINSAECNLVVYSDAYPEWNKPSNGVEIGLRLKPGEVRL